MLVLPDLRAAREPPAACATRTKALVQEVLALLYAGPWCGRGSRSHERQKNGFCTALVAQARILQTFHSKNTRSGPPSLWSEKYSELMNDLYEFLVEFMGAVRQRAVRGQAILPLLLQSHLPRCHSQPVYLAELQCQYLPPRSYYHTLSSCCQPPSASPTWISAASLWT